jgi:hypothetical protein
MGRPIRIRNSRGQPIPCCYGPCWKPADARHRVEQPHEQPRFPGELLIYTYCSETCRLAHIGQQRPATRSPLGLWLPPRAATVG